MICSSNTDSCVLCLHNSVFGVGNGTENTDTFDVSTGVDTFLELVGSVFALSQSAGQTGKSGRQPRSADGEMCPCLAKWHCLPLFPAGGGFVVFGT